MSPDAPLAVGRAPGKIILVGEHAVVYGHPALAAAVGLYTTVTLRRRPGATDLERSAFTDERLLRALHTVLPSEGFGVDIESELPAGRGMGSSASIAVALVRAAAAAAGERLGRRALFERSLDVERIFHGEPSGVDNAVVLRGGLVHYRKGPPLEVSSQPVSQPLPVVILDSGRAGNTADMVARVRVARSSLDATLERIGALVERARALLGDRPALGRLFDENHALLCQLGVSTPALDSLCAMARRNGALGAKLSGAGGGGVVLALVETASRPGLLAAAQRAGVRAFSADLPALSATQEAP